MSDGRGVLKGRGVALVLVGLGLCASFGPWTGQQDAGAAAVDTDGQVEPPDPARERAAQVLDSLAVGTELRKAVELAELGEPEVALALVELGTGPERFDQLSEPERAALDLVRALLILQLEPELLALREPFTELDESATERLDAARAALERARAEARAGEVRRRAVMALGTLELRVAERDFRRFVTEAQAGGGTAPSAPGEEPVDPLERIRALQDGFRGARDVLVERVRLEWSDPDPRANLEWAQRRLRELEELEQEEQERQEQQEQDQQEQDQPQDQDQQDQGDDQQPSDEQQQDQEPDEEGEQQDEPQPEDEGQQDESEQPQEPVPEEGEESQPQPAEAEQQLSQEEIVELLDRLEELEELAEAIREQQRRVGRRAVERDW